MNPGADQLKSHPRWGRHPQGCCLFPEHSLRIVWSLRGQLTLNVLKLSCFLNEKLDTCSNREVPSFHKYFFKWVVRLKYTDNRFLLKIYIEQNKIQLSVYQVMRYYVVNFPYQSISSFSFIQRWKGRDLGARLTWFQFWLPPFLILCL